MRLLPALPRSVTALVSIAILLAWAASMAVVVNRSYLLASTVTLATDLARYGSAAVWRGVYYRGEKIGFTVGQTVPTDDGYELHEDARLQMTLLGATTPAVIRTTAHVDRSFRLRSFEFSLDPGTGPVHVRGRLDGLRLALAIASPSRTWSQDLVLAEPPALSLNLGRRLANEGLAAGTRHQWTMFDPATLANAPVTIDVGPRELVRTGSTRVPAFRVEMEFTGVRTTSWVTDTGEVVREESPLGLMTIREPAERAQGLAIPERVQSDLLRAAAVVPVTRFRIDETRDVRRIRLRLDGADLSSADLHGVGQTVDGNALEIRNLQDARPTRAEDPDARRYVPPEPLIESDAPEIRSEAERAVQGVAGDRPRAEALTRYVNGLLEKKPTIGLPSAREVLRTRVGDCNEHTALYVAMARAIGIPARIAVGLVHVRGAFYYHAWPEVYLAEPNGRGMWLPVDPTLNQFPADATHVRLARGGLDRQTAILPLIGRLRITVIDLELAPNAAPAVAPASSPVLRAVPLPAGGRPWWRRCP